MMPHIASLITYPQKIQNPNCLIIQAYVYHIKKIV